MPRVDGSKLANSSSLLFRVSDWLVMTAVAGASVPAASRKEDRVRKRRTFQRRRERRDTGGSGDLVCFKVEWSTQKRRKMVRVQKTWLNGRRHLVMNVEWWICETAMNINKAPNSEHRIHTKVYIEYNEKCLLWIYNITCSKFESLRYKKKLWLVAKKKKKNT